MDKWERGRGDIDILNERDGKMKFKDRGRETSNIFLYLTYYCTQFKHI